MKIVGAKPTGTFGAKDIDATVTGEHLLLEAEGGADSIPTRVAAIAQVVTGFTSAPSFSVGTNDPDYNNLLSDTAFSTLVATGIVKQKLLEDSLVLGSGTEVKMKINTAAVATTFTLKVGVEVAKD